MVKLKSLNFVLNFLINSILWNLIKCDNDDYDLIRISNEIMKSFNRMHHLSNINKTCSEYCVGKNEQCNSWGLCECKLHYEFDEFSKKCVLCPGFGEFCFTDCCSSSTLQCVNNRCIVTISKPGVFMTATQIALSAALIMAIAALIMVTYRLCSKPRSRQDIESITIARTPQTGTTNFFRESLSSMQIRILSRLRDRPPTYDEMNSTRQNNNNNNTINQNNNNTPQPIATIPTMIQTIPEAPPPYEADRGVSTTQQPPPYSEVIISPANLDLSTCQGGQNLNNLSLSQENLEEVTKSSEKNENQEKIITKQNL